MRPTEDEDGEAVADEAERAYAVEQHAGQEEFEEEVELPDRRQRHRVVVQC